MKASKLYKYLDVDGGLAMLSNSNLQFTNATKLDDPFAEDFFIFTLINRNLEEWLKISSLLEWVVVLVAFAATLYHFL